MVKQSKRERLTGEHMCGVICNYYLSIHTRIYTYRLIEDDDDDDDHDDVMATKKDYIKDTNSYIYKYMPICVHIHIKNAYV